VYGREDKDLSAHDETTANLRPRLTVMISGTFLREIMSWNSEELERTRHKTWRDIQELGET